jgi:hypothetical protein
MWPQEGDGPMRPQKRQEPKRLKVGEAPMRLQERQRQPRPRLLRQPQPPDSRLPSVSLAVKLATARS